MHAQTARPIARIDAWQRIGVDHDAPALLHQIDIDNPSGDRDRPEVALQHRRRVLPGGYPHQGKAGGKDSECERRSEPHAMPTHRSHRAGTGNGRSDARP